METLAYCGSIWSRNVGDESIYLANHKLFSDYQIIPSRHDDHSNTLILGGGTILPRALKSEWEIYDATPRAHNYCVGIGVRDPDYWNQAKGAFDLRQSLGKRGINISRRIKGNRLLSYVTDRFTPDSLILTEEYCFEEDFEAISQFGFDRISVRGPQSQEILRQYDIESTVVGDPALYLEPPEYHSEQTNEIVVCLMKPYVGKWSENTDYIDVLISSLNEKYAESKVTYMPFNHSDIPVNLAAAQKTKNADLYVTNHLQFNEILSKISQADFVIGERLHSVILSAACHTPFAALSYRPKHHDFAASIDMSEYVLKTIDVTPDRLHALLDTIQSDYISILKSLEQEVSIKRKRLESFANEVTSDLISSSYNR
ncbi:polysaccharide pyruvyl transferase family protein [Halorubrum ezzemoulense]|uniref:polysaccharide pyruvyl transferase family protein n=1 Tax=Halorubrum TaxID=56688 RepID=UPI0010F526D4|nr:MULTISPECIES: polysaccharide pyruvyl transferase family protein [Halorubrum]MDB2253412.1 polysaccharide pyruvyl transferase family protein [Halorubrum ezzemoulense]TKX63969.1 hypothetical protein EXE47_13525 [Halorubrum sp. GN12_10-3_MGM]